MISEAFSYAYCDNCNNSDSLDNCEDCHRKYQNWKASKEICNILAENILEKINANKSS
jgi:methionyl-tRNA synthetase